MAGTSPLISSTYNSPKPITNLTLQMHCHIGWHVSEGLALQFIERESEIAALLDMDELESTCKTWDAYQGLGKLQEDSGV